MKCSIALHQTNTLISMLLIWRDVLKEHKSIKLSYGKRNVNKQNILYEEWVMHTAWENLASNHKGRRTFLDLSWSAI